MDFRELLERHRIVFHDSGKMTRPGWLNFACPYCRRDPYMGYNLRGRYVHCWSCGRHALWHALHRLTGLPEKECVLLVCELPREAERWEGWVRHQGVLKLPMGSGPLQPVHSKYLSDRGFDAKVLIQRYSLLATGMISDVGYRWRIVIPVFCKGEMVSWTTRAIGDVEVRYRAAEDERSRIPIENLIYNVDTCTNAIVLVEGPADVWAGGDGFGALFGMRASPAQLEQLSRFAVRVVCFDNEDQAQERATVLCRDLAPLGGKTVRVRLGSGKDLAEARDHEIETLRRKYLIGRPP
jgi:hypothetical protein